MRDDSKSSWSRRRLLGGAAATVGASAVVSAGAGNALAAGVGSPTDGTARPWPSPTPELRATEITPSDPRYQDLVRGMNQRWVGRPESVRVVGSPAQVVGVVREAVARDKKLTVRSGGHCYEDFVFNPGTQIVLDMSEMTSVYWDQRFRAFAVEAGAKLLDVYERLFKGWGVTVPGGMCYSVGVGGHVSGGGWGMLAREHGLIVDHLYAVEVVVADAEGNVRAVIATREADDPNRELWWAHTGGGGGNFGVITRYWFRSPAATGTAPEDALVKPPGEVFLSAISWPWERMTERAFIRLSRNFGDWHVANIRPGGRYSGLMSFLQLNHRSNGEIGLLTQMDATVPGARRLLDAFLDAVTDGVDVPVGPVTRAMGEHGPMPEYFEPRRMPWLQSARYLGTTNSTLVDPTLRGDYKSSFHKRNLDDEQFATIHRHLTRTEPDNPRAMVLISSYGGAVNAVRPQDTAYAHRDSAFKLLFQSYWSDPAEDGTNITWLRELYKETYRRTGGVPVPDRVTDGCYVNYADIDLNDPRYNTSGVPWYTLYYGANYPRLQRIKAAYDPADRFRHGQSIRLP
ncbi:FAD-binding protein [Streptomyces alkaliphilus]|uniref:FAD-binding protein n=1 Tax=Streptomyces alkaliphilus TaxID=1472722 RepID=A0A7W3TA49_9ACTN|nr:FAD-binding protein [Streptomyces alkaliphilus]MBB0243081.1 FAD-binding protein [Streptomyces alkaliphilus]